MNYTQQIPADTAKRLEWLYNQFGKKLCGYAVKVYHLKEDDAWDLVYKAIYKINDTCLNYTFDSPEKFNGFVFRVFINYLKNFFRDTSKKPSPVYLEERMEQESYPEELTERTDPAILKLNEELEKLEDWERVLLLLRSQEMPYSEIAVFINKSESQLKVYYGRLKSKIAERMKMFVKNLVNHE